MKDTEKEEEIQTRININDGWFVGIFGAFFLAVIFLFASSFLVFFLDQLAGFDLYSSFEAANNLISGVSSFIILIFIVFSISSIYMLKGKLEQASTEIIQLKEEINELKKM